MHSQKPMEPQTAQEGDPSKSAAVTKPHPAARSLAEIFPPQHVQEWKPFLELYFPIGASCMAHSACYPRKSLSGACLSSAGKI